MIWSKMILSCITGMCIVLPAPLQGVNAQDKRSPERETDPLVLQKLEWFKDMKFGLLMHWGPYSQWGIVESWSLCPEDEGWCQRRGPHAAVYGEYKQAYENLKTTFDPAKFNPDQWASAAKAAGMRYVIFTTKHHDGFCMFDTRQTDYKITDEGCPFHTHSRRNVTKEIFDSFREEGFGIGAYFSKPDWHAGDYWWSYFPPRDRNVNYDITKHPGRWESFKRFTYEQIKELMSEYGNVDILWLDGGWVNPGNQEQDIDMPRIAGMARSFQPGLIIVDRAVPGRYENYRTPEQEVPETPPDYVWETCMTMATSWSYVPNDTYKPAVKLVHLLVDVVAKGGNFLLNIGPSPAGELPPASLDRLREIGDWMKVNGGAIYSTRPVAPHVDGRIRFTQMPDGGINAIYLAGGNETRPPATVTITANTPKTGSTVRMLGVRKPLKWEPGGRGFVIHVPEDVRDTPPCSHAWTFQYSSR